MTLAGLLLGGCESTKPQYSRPLPPGVFGLRRITDPARMPDLEPVVQQLGNSAFVKALNRSLAWYKVPSSHQRFPAGPISHVHAQVSAYALAQLARDDLATRRRLLHSDFDVWESIGWDGSGEMLFTAYYSPVFTASRQPTEVYRYPLYRRPDDLVSDPTTGKVLGKRTPGGGLVTYPTRAQLMRGGALRGLELVYLPSRLDAYIIEVNGSAKLRMQDGSILYVGYAGSNGQPYTSVGKLLVDAGKIDPDRLSLATLRAYFQNNPEELNRVILQNPRFVFFQPYKGDNWPAGSLGFQVTPMRSLATDKAIFPPACVVLVKTQMPRRGGGDRPFDQLMLDQDTGGAIRAAGRADIYLGVGVDAEQIAGQEAATGRMYYLLLKRDRVQAWYDRMMSEKSSHR